jgi:hypothetical protein
MGQDYIRKEQKSDEFKVAGDSPGIAPQASDNLREAHLIGTGRGDAPIQSSRSLALKNSFKPSTTSPYAAATGKTARASKTRLELAASSRLDKSG